VSKRDMRQLMCEVEGEMRWIPRVLGEQYGVSSCCVHGHRGHSFSRAREDPQMNNRNGESPADG